MDVRPWRDTLDAMTQPDGWIGCRDRKANLAHEALAGYGQPDGWIRHSIPAHRVRTAAGEDKATKPGAAYDAEEEREAVLQLAVLHELRKWDPTRQDRDFDMSELMHAVVRAAFTGPMGLRAKSVDVKEARPYQEVDFAHGENAKRFFVDVLRPRLQRIDEKTNVGLAQHLPRNYEPDDEASIEQWGRVWTAGTALVPLEWAYAKGCRSAKDISRSIWCASDPAGHALGRFHPSAALIPTERKLVLTAHAGVRTRAAVGYAFAGSEEIRQLEAEAHTLLSLGLRALSDARRVGEEKLYDGYNRSHLYLAVLSDSIYVANAAPAMPKREPPLTGPAGDDSDGLGAFAPEQRAALALTSTARERLKALAKAKTSAQSFYPVRKPVPRGADAGADAVGEWTSISQGSLRFLPAPGTPGARWQPIGSIDLWHELGADLDWIDFMVVARIDDRQVPLPVMMDDQVLEDSAAERTVLVLDEDASPPFSAAALRRVLELRDALVGVVIRKGLGAFVVLEIDTNAQHASDIRG